jgi:hypothetical protein
MLGLHNTLVFPAIKYVGKEELISPDKRNQPTKTHIYKLDWTDFDKALKARHRRKFGPYIKALPEEYEALLENSLFALDSNYIREIERNSRRAVIEWSINRSFDTVIKEMCLKPAIEHIKVTFKLIRDGLYDPDTKYMSNKPHQWFISNAMIYKFWRHQTGGALPIHFSGITKLEERLSRFTPEEQTEITTFIKAVKEHEKALTTPHKK